MNILVIGLGSMGKRRIRNLKVLEYKNIYGFDIRLDRCKEVENKYKIKTFANFEDAIEFSNPNILVISTPPDKHMFYANFAFNHSIDAFIEASVVDSDKIFELSQKLENKNFLILPSCTMRYFPFVKELTTLVKNNTIGKILNINYQVGQYLPDWHPWENIKDYYVSNIETGAAREIVPFELTWLNELFGKPKELSCIKRKLSDLNTNIDDIYHIILEYPGNILTNLTIEVISRPKATRELTILGSLGKIIYSQEKNELKYTHTDIDNWKYINFKDTNIENNYIYSETPYIEEIKDFMDSIKLHKNKQKIFYTNTLKNDYDVLQNLYNLEKINYELSK